MTQRIQNVKLCVRNSRKTKKWTDREDGCVQWELKKKIKGLGSKFFFSLFHFGKS